MADARAQLVDDLPYFISVIKIVRRRLPAHVRDECESEAMVAMVEAADAWQEGTVPFRLFVAKRIQHRMQDEARKFGHISRRTKTSRDSHSLDERVGPDEGGDTHRDRLEATSGDPYEAAVASELRSRVDALPQRWGIAFNQERDQAAETLGVSIGRIDQLRSSAREVLAGTRKPPKIRGGGPLSDRELEVLRHIAEGETNLQIAAGIGITQETVKTHIRHLLRKLNARSRAQAVNIAWQAGWWEKAAS